MRVSRLWRPGVLRTVPFGVGTGAIAVLTLGAVSSPAPEVDWAAVDALFAEYDRSDSPGCGLGVVRDGSLEYGRGYGMANLDHGIAITPQSVFRTGSVAKQFTAAAVAIAAHEAAISLDDPVRKWITDLPSYPVDPTIRQVVHHTSGLRDYLTLMSLRGLRSDDYYTNAEVRAAIARQRELNFTPGSDYLYSNSGYFILGEIIRAATGMTLKEYAQSRIFGPLEMMHTHFHDDHNHIVASRATGYAPTEDGYRISVTNLEMIGDGGVFTSIEDLAHWVDALNENRLGPGLKSVLESTVPLTGGDPNSYAFGQTVGEYRGLRSVSHGGAFVGYRASITRFPEQGVSIVLACNRADASPSRMALRVADIVLADEVGMVEPPGTSTANANDQASPVPGPVDGPAAYVGTYYSSELDADYRLSVSEGVLQLTVGAGIRAELRQIEPDLLEAGGPQLRFERVDGRVVGFDVDAGRVRNLSFERTGG